jgi:mono/diheme cytochrome c family protein
MRRYRIIAASSAALAFAQAADAAPSAARGKDTFHRVGCYECHNYQGQGGVGPRLTAVSFDRLKTYVRTANGDMPPYRPAILSDDDIADIYAYLTSIPKPPAADSIKAVKNLQKTGP